MSELPCQLYTPEQVRELDRRAIEDHGIPGEVLMDRAGRGAYRLLRRQWPGARRVLVLCGGGNNGGDGYVIARLAANAGLTVRLAALTDPDRLTGAAAVAMQRCREVVEPRPWSAKLLDDIDVVVDALLGTGLDRPVSGHYAKVIAAANECSAGRLAVDVPSGLNAESGVCLGVAFRADATVTFIGVKQGLLTGEAPDYVGTLTFYDLGVPDSVGAKLPPSAERIDAAGARQYLPPRRPTGHKGDYGHVLVVGGDHGFGGAVRLAGEAAARGGAGLVTVATRETHVVPLLAARPELMVHAVSSTADLVGMIERASVVAVGPGLGQQTWGRELLAATLDAELPVVVDADALNLIAQWGCVPKAPCVLTPHPGEAGRLLGETAGTVQSNRFAAMDALLARFNGAVVLKGAGTLIGAGQQRWLCSSGNPGMASGGMGDVLTGLVAAFLAQGLRPEEAATTAVAIHATAADCAAKHGVRGLLASDLLEQLRGTLVG